MKQIESSSAPAGNPALRRLAAKASAVTPSELAEFVPTKVHTMLAGALMAGVIPTSLEDLAAHVGLPRHVVQRAMQKSSACAWVVGEAARLAKFGVAGAYIRLMKEAHLNKSPKWMDMYLRRFDPEYAQAGNPQGPAATHNTQVNIFGSWTEEELQAFIRDKRQKVMGEQQSAS